MTVKDKIEQIEKFSGLVFFISYFFRHFSIGTVASFLLNKNLIDNQTFDKLCSIGLKVNFWDNYLYDKPLNSHSILFVNLVYGIIKKNEVNS